ncbi:hypothetical protein [Fulvivirga sediminis]|uniref:Uncharacterized protein n=1 Tax=Fulvivirga sediminis TaxID=2803949 RepID=A0A937FA27_9BACT|nr:hypothetical protein [Fulvivirga sediminis]MBL3656703.1 hypothetical protein [Fulvivirga sediminis]
MRLLSYFTLLTIFHSIKVYGQDDKSIKLTPFFKESQTKSYQITSTSKTSTKDGHYEVFNSKIKDVIVKVTKVTAAQSHIEWTYDRVMFVDSTEQNDPFTYLINTLNKRMTIKYVVDSKGVIQAISNSEDLKSQTKQQIDGFVKQLSQSDNYDESSIEAFKFQLDMMLSSQELFDALILEDVYKFHELYSLSFQKGRKVLVPEKGTPTDSYSIELISSNQNEVQLFGELVSSFSDKKGQKKYEFNLPSYWLEHYSAKWHVTVPVNVSYSYSIEQVNP